MKLKILSIGYGRQLFNKNNVEHQRLDSCAKEVNSIDHIVFTNKKDGLNTLVTKNNFRLHPTNSVHKIFMMFDAIRIGFKIIHEREVDVISTQDLFETGLVGLILKFRYPKITLQVQEHGDVMSSEYWRKEKFSNQLRYWFARVLLNKADIVRVVSERTKIFLQKILGADKNIKKLPVVVDTSSFSHARNNEVSEKKDTFTFITAARFVPQKNFSLMLKAFAASHRTCPRIRLRIFGEGPLQNVINKMIEELNLSTVVEVHGWTDDLAGEMAKADAYLLTSNYEGWGRVLIEAMLQRLPVVTTDVGCANEVVKDDEHALIVPVDNVAKLTDAINTMCSDQVLYKKLSDNLSRLTVDTIPGTRIDEYPSLWLQTMC